MNAYKNSIREYGRLSALPGRRKRRERDGTEVVARGMLPALDLRLEYLIDSVLLAHACASTAANRDGTFRETLLVRDAERTLSLSLSLSLVPPFSSLFIYLFFLFFPEHSRRASHFSKRNARDAIVVISGGIEKDRARDVTQNALFCLLCRLLCSNG